MHKASTDGKWESIHKLPHLDKDKQLGAAEPCVMSTPDYCIKN